MSSMTYVHAGAQVQRALGPQRVVRTDEPGAERICLLLPEQWPDDPRQSEIKDGMIAAFDLLEIELGWDHPVTQTAWWLMRLYSYDLGYAWAHPGMLAGLARVPGVGLKQALVELKARGYLKAVETVRAAGLRGTCRYYLGTPAVDVEVR